MGMMVRFRDYRRQATTSGAALLEPLRSACSGHHRRLSQRLPADQRTANQVRNGTPKSMPFSQIRFRSELCQLEGVHGKKTDSEVPVADATRGNAQHADPLM